MVILGLVFIVSDPCKYSVKYVNFGSTRVMLVLVPFPRPKVVILGLVFVVSVPCKYSVKNVNFGSTGAG